VKRHVGRLEEYWKVKKNDTDFHKLKFNNSYENPLITVQGWNKFRDFHDLPANVQIELLYHGKNIYEIFEITDLDNGKVIPEFHSRSMHSYKTEWFDVDITLANWDAPKLVSKL
jgi:hypothetical protein